MSAARLLVLGIIRTQKQAHGYWVYRELLSWRIETWANVKPGSIYHALKQLEKQKLLHPVAMENSEEGPNRTIYELTAQGEVEFYKLLEKALIDIDMHFFGAGIAFMTALPAPRILELVNRRLQELQKVRADLVTMSVAYPHSDQPPHNNILFSQWIAFFDSAITWTHDFLLRLQTDDTI